jgi:hypothetical protein
MGVFAWIFGLNQRPRAARPKRNRNARWDREALAPHLRVRRLEERRVLNADAAPVQQLVVDAGSAAGDGQADTFIVEQRDNQLSISVNGQEIARAEANQFDSIKIKGSADDDLLIAEFKSGEPLAGMSLLFEGNDGADTLALQGDTAASDVTYNFGEDGANRVGVESSTGDATIAFSGIESVQDQLAAANRDFRFESGGDEITLSDAGSANDDVSRLDVKDSFEQSQLSVIFKNPTESLSVDTKDASETPDSLAVESLDANYAADLNVVGSPDDLLTVRGPTDLGGGDLQALMGTIKIENSLTTTHAEFRLRASSEVVVNEAGILTNDAGSISLEAPSINHNGFIVAHSGQVWLDSGAEGTTIVRGTIDVSGDAEMDAGSVYVLGKNVGLFDNAQINATALVGGGTILIGGDYQGKNVAVRNAARTYVGPNTVIRADAITNGNGGKVIVWADEAAFVYGDISTRGGADRGDGGFIETSGKRYLDFQGTVNASAANGAAGTWLLDPENLEVTAVSANLLPIPPLADPGPIVFSPLMVLAGLGNTTVAAADIITALNFGSNVTLNTTLIAGGAEPGTITVNAPIVKALDGGNADGSVLTFISAGDIIVNSAITSILGPLSVVFTAGAAGIVDINAAITTLGGSVTSSGTTFDNTGGAITTTGGNVLITHTGAVTIGAAINAAAGDVRVLGQGSITQAAAGIITADELGIRQTNAAAGDVTLTANNDVDELAVNNAAAGGTVSFTDTDGLTIDSVAASGAFLATSGITTNDGDVLLDVGGPLTINQAIDALNVGATADVRLVANGNISQAAAGTITANDLGIRQSNAAAGNVTLTANNDVDVLAVSNAAAAGTVSFTDTDDLTIDAVAASGTFLATSGITTNDGNLLLNAGGALTINQAIDVLNVGLLSDVRLVAGGAITQAAAGTITANELGIRQSNAVAGNITLTANNDVDLLAVNNVATGGTVSFTDTDDLTIGAVAASGTFLATSGITTNDGDVLLSVGGLLTINQAIDVLNVGATADVRLVVNGAITQAAAGTIAANELGIRQTNAAAGNVTLTANNDVDVLAVNNAAAGGTVSFTDSDDLTIGSVAASGTFLATSGITTNDGDVLLNVGGLLTINQAIDVLNVGLVSDVRLVGNGNITQAAAGTITANDLGIRQQNAVTGNVTLTANNDVDVFAVNNAAAGGTVSFTDTDDLTIGAVAASGTFLATSGITTNDGNLLLNAGGALTINQAIDVLNVGATADARFVANGAITQAAAGTIAANELGIRQTNAAAGNVTLTANNDVDVLAVNNAAAAGTVSFTDIDDLAIGSVAASGSFALTTGVTTIDGNITINANAGTLDINNLVSSSTGSIALTGDAVTQDANITTGGAGTVGVTSDVGDITMASGTSTTTDAGDITYSADDNVALALLKSTTGAVSVTAGVGAAVSNITDANGTSTNIEAPTTTLIADTSIGTVTSFSVSDFIPLPEPSPDSNNAGNAIELTVGTVAGSLKATANKIHLLQTGPAGAARTLTLGAGAIDITGNGQAIISATGDLHAGNATAIALNNDDLALLSGGKLTIPDAGLDAGTGDLRMVGVSDIVADTPGNLIFKGDNLAFHSGGVGGDATLKTDVASINTISPTKDTLDANDLVIDEANDVVLTRVTTKALTALSITVTTGGTGKIDVGLVQAAGGNQAVTLNSGGAINSLSNDGTADVLGSTIDLTAKSSGIGTTTILDVTATTSLIATTDFAVDANILIDSIGDLPVGKVTAGGADVTLDSTGDMDSVANDDTADVEGATLNLLAKVGGIGTDSVVDVKATTALNANTVLGSGDQSSILLDSLIDLPIGLVNAGAGNVTLVSKGDMDSVTNNAVADVNGATLDLTAEVGGIGTDSVLDVTATTALSAKTVADNSNILIDGIGNLPLGLINAGTLDAVGKSEVTLDSTGAIIDEPIADDLATDVIAKNALLIAQTGIGSLTNVIDTSVIRFEGDGKTGGLFISDENALTIGFGIVDAQIGATADGAVNIRTLTSGLTLMEQVVSDFNSVTLRGNTLLTINADVLATNPGTGNITASVDVNDPGAITIETNAALPATNNILATASGQISGQVLVRVGGKFTALDGPGSVNRTVGALPGSGGLGEIQVEILDDKGKNITGTNFQIQIDWRGGTLPAGVLNDRFVNDTINGSPPALLDADRLFQHNYGGLNNPLAAFVSNGFIHTFVKITGFAQNSILLQANGNENILNVDADETGGITTIIDIPFAGVVGRDVPVSEPLPTVVASRPVVAATVDTSQPIDVSATPLAASATGVTGTFEERYYELRIVSFDNEGNPKEDLENGVISLDSREEIGIYPFDLSKLQELFGRLPADRYRLYLIEDGAARLILDFTIQQGQPIETSDVEESGNQGDDAGTPFKDDESGEPTIKVNPLEDNNLPVPPAALPVDDRAAGLAPGTDPLAELRLDPVSARSRAAESFAERLGNTSFLSHGGLVVGAAALAYTKSDRWEKSIDRLMERFDRRRRPAGNNATTTVKRRAPQVTSIKSPKRPK